MVVQKPDPHILVHGKPLSFFQSVQHVALPQGLEKIGDSWFTRDKIQSIIIPSSVTEIGPAVFYWCKELKSAEFQKGSKLRKVGEHCFGRSGLVKF